MTLLLTALAAMAAGCVNSIAGGGTLLTFPSLLALGMDNKTANATSTLGLWPASLGGAWGYRDEILRGERDLLFFLVPSFLGGLTGAVLLVWTHEKTFAALVPWLILAATILFMLQGRASAWLERRRKSPEPAGRRWAVIAPLQFAVSVYGGYFGAGMGILMLAALGLMGIQDIHHRNGVKNLAALAINGVAIGHFIFHHLIEWQTAGVMAVASLIGGYLSTALARWMGREKVRTVVVLVGLVSSAWTAYRWTQTTAG